MLGLKIKAYMDARGIKQTFLADKTNMGLTTIKQFLMVIEKSKQTNITIFAKLLINHWIFSFRKKNKHTFDKKNIPLLRMCVNWEKEVREVEERTEMERLETAILNFIEKTVNEPVSEKDVEILPALAHELIELWKI